jgi:hypothetical protein
LTEQTVEQPPRIRVARSLTLAVGPHYEKAEFEVESTAFTSVEAAIQKAQAILEEHIRKFKEKHEQTLEAKPSEANAGEKLWKPWSSGIGESLREDMDLKLAQFLTENKHDGRNPYRCEDGYDYWLYPFNPEPGRARFIQRVKRR